MRRSAIGLLRTIIDNKLNLKLRNLISYNIKLLEEQGVTKTNQNSENEFVEHLPQLFIIKKYSILFQSIAIVIPTNIELLSRVKFLLLHFHLNSMLLLVLQICVFSGSFLLVFNLSIST